MGFYHLTMKATGPAGISEVVPAADLAFGTPGENESDVFIH